MPRAGLFAVYPPKSRWGAVPPAPVFWAHLDRKLAKSHPPLDLATLSKAISDQLIPEPEEIASMPTEARSAGEDPDRRYFLHGPAVGGPAPKKGRPLLVVLPGGPGTAEFRTFVKLIGKNSGGDEWLVAQLIAKKWTEKQEVIWPTERTRVTGQKFSTEEFIDSVIAEVTRLREVDPKRIVVLAWSSGGPAAYSHALRPNTAIPVDRYFISQSVFHTESLPPLAGAKGKRFYLHHSRTDAMCEFADAEEARDRLRPAGAAVELVEYEGGHGWYGDMYDQIRKGIGWLLAG
jgi:poly(3-hydroxybutyrate) depolymerase